MVNLKFLKPNFLADCAGVQCTVETPGTSFPPPLPSVCGKKCFCFSTCFVGTCGTQCRVKWTIDLLAYSDEGNLHALISPSLQLVSIALLCSPHALGMLLTRCCAIIHGHNEPVDLHQNMKSDTQRTATVHLVRVKMAKWPLYPLPGTSSAQTPLSSDMTAF